MKKGLFSFAAPVTVALILGLAVYAVPATGTSTSLAGRVTKLEASNKKLTALSAKLTLANVKLTKRVANLEGFAACNNSAGPVTIAGDSDQTKGLGYEFTADNKVTVTLAQALQPTVTGGTPDAFLQLVDPKCVSTSQAKALHARHLGALVHSSH
jgi:hypothetical protein